MDSQGFQRYLHERGFTAEQAERFAAFAARFAAACEAPGARSLVEAFSQFSRQMMQEGANTGDNYYALGLYGEFVGDRALALAGLELTDGCEVLDNLYRKTGEVLGPARRDEIFAGVTLVPVGTPNTEKPAVMQAMIERLEAAEPEACRTILASGLRDLPDESYAAEKARFQLSRDIDDYLLRKKEALLAHLRELQRKGRLYWDQEITDEVIEFVRQDPEIGQGVRVGRIIYQSKIPHRAEEFLAETDADRKRYHYCHCPWAKESLRHGRSSIPPVFCNCSAAFMKKPWEVIFGQELQADVLESVLQGDVRCRFAIHLPERQLHRG